RDVDVEDPPPGDRSHDDPAEERPRDARDAEHGAEEALVAAALARRYDVADDRLHQHDQAAGAEALNRAEGDQLRHTVRLATERRADEEEDDRALEHALAAVEVAELAVDRRHRGLREEECARHPREPIEAAEVADDRG